MRSNLEAHLVGDVFDEGGKAVAFLGDRDEEALLEDEAALYAVERAVMNVTEAIIQLERGTYPGRFEELFPGQSFDRIRRLGNATRHDYTGVDADEVALLVRTLITELRDRAEQLLASHRRLRGG